MQRLRNRAVKSMTPPLFPSKKKLDAERQKLEEDFEYCVDEFNVVKLRSIYEAVRKRASNLNLENRIPLLSVDKGQGKEFLKIIRRIFYLRQSSCNTGVPISS